VTSKARSSFVVLCIWKGICIVLKINILDVVKCIWRHWLVWR